MAFHTRILQSNARYGRVNAKVGLCGTSRYPTWPNGNIASDTGYFMWSQEIKKSLLLIRRIGGCVVGVVCKVIWAMLIFSNFKTGERYVKYVLPQASLQHVKGQ